MSKARVYLYDKQRIIQKVVMLDKNGNEGEPLTWFIHYGFDTNSILFGDELQIRFFIYDGGIKLYRCNADELEFINNSDKTYHVRCQENDKYLNPKEKWLCRVMNRA